MSDCRRRQNTGHRWQEVSARAGQTILEVARENGIEIPTLCHLDGLTDVGACRLCVVEIKGNNKLLPACVTTVFEGMEVTTQTERLQKAPPHDSRTAVRRAQSRLLGLRCQTGTASCRRWRRSRA